MGILLDFHNVQELILKIFKMVVSTGLLDFRFYRLMNCYNFFLSVTSNFKIHALIKPFILCTFFMNMAAPFKKQSKILTKNVSRLRIKNKLCNLHFFDTIDVWVDYKAFHMGLHCLPKYSFMAFLSTLDKVQS